MKIKPIKINVKCMHTSIIIIYELELRYNILFSISKESNLQQLAPTWILGLRAYKQLFFEKAEE